MAKTGIFTQILGYDPEERKRKRQEEAARVSASLLSGDPYRSIGFSIGQLFGAGANKLFGSEDPEIKFQSTVRDAISSASQNYEAGSADYYKALAASLPQTSEYANSIATARELAQKAGQEEEKQFRDTTKFVADNPEALTGEAQKLNARIAARLRAEGVDPTQPLSRVNEITGVAEPIDPVYSEKVNQFIQALPETQRLNALTQAATRGSMKLDMDLNKPESMPKIGFAADDGQAVYRQGDQQFKLGVGGKRTPYFGGFRKEGGDITINTPKERFAVIEQFRGAVKPITDRMSSLNRALVLNARTGSSFSSAAFKQEVGTLFGDAVKAAKEIQALANTGSLDERIAGSIISFLEGKSTSTQKADRDATLKAIRSALRDEYEQTADMYRTALADKDEAPRLFPAFEKRYPQTRGLEPNAPAAPGTVSLSAAQKKDPLYAEGSVFTKPDGSVYTVQKGVLVKQKKKEQ
jgi:hypothetical protein